MRKAIPVVVCLALAGACCLPQGCSPPKKGGASQPATATAAGVETIGKIVIDSKARTVSVPAVVAKQNVYEVLKGAIEYAVVSKGGKEYETVFTIDARPEDLFEALVKVGARPGSPGDGENPSTGWPVRVFVDGPLVVATSLPASGPASSSSPALKVTSATTRRSMDEFILDNRTNKPLSGGDWIFTGSIREFDDNTGRELVKAGETKSVIALTRGDLSALLLNAHPGQDAENIHRVNSAILPPEGTTVTLVFHREVPKTVFGNRRVHIFAAGQVQGVGFAQFVQHEARWRRLTGTVKELADGPAEIVAEGAVKDVGEFIEAIKRGTRTAKIEKFDVIEEAPEGEFDGFEVK